MEEIKIIEGLLMQTKQQMADIAPFIAWLAFEPRSTVQVEMYFWMREKYAEQYLSLLKRHAELVAIPWSRLTREKR